MNLLDRLKLIKLREEAERAGPAPVPVARVLFVCMGNICRSPTAEGVFRKVLAERAPDLLVEVDSAGTHAYHVGEPPDPRARRAAERRGINLEGLRARVVTFEDFERYDLLLAMDSMNREALLQIGPPQHHRKVRLLLEFAPHLGRKEVPDPYYGGINGFEHVLDLVEEASIGLLEHLRRHAAQRLANPDLPPLR
ncbi:MAG TPA: low molecular weight protein-tyrosine-phosphatase [Gammaproteobacteria bacterium]